MPAHVVVWDIETVPDLRGFAAANGHDGKSDDEVREAMGDKFPKHIYHSIICIGALVAQRDNAHWKGVPWAHPTSGNGRQLRDCQIGMGGRLRPHNALRGSLSPTDRNMSGINAVASMTSLIFWWACQPSS